MKPKDFWDAFVPDQSPGEFMCQFLSRNPQRCAERYVARLPGVYGVVCKGSWRETFDEREHPTRAEIAAALTTYLDENRAEWEAALEEKAVRDAANRERAVQEAAEQEQAEKERAAQEAIEREQATQEAPPDPPPVSTGEPVSENEEGETPASQEDDSGGAEQTASPGPTP